MLILVTRPEPDASRTAARLADMGHQALIEPVLVFERIANRQLPAGTYDAIAVTSANAIRAAEGLNGLKDLRSVPVFAVGASTAEAVKAAGFAKVTYSAGDAESLAKLIRQLLKPGTRVLHLAGEHRAKDFSALLAPARIDTVTLVLYRMRASAELSPAVTDAIAQGRVNVVLHYSTRSASLFVTLMQRAGFGARLSSLRHLCLSQAVAAPLIATGASTEAATKPDENTLLSMI